MLSLNRSNEEDEFEYSSLSYVRGPGAEPVDLLEKRSRKVAFDFRDDLDPEFA